MSDQVRVSVCMAVYNGARYLPEQLASILEQIGGSDELVCVDDGSADGSTLLIEGLGDPRVRLVANSARLGPVKTFERAMSLARGEFLVLSDQDDVWLPGRLDAALAALDPARGQGCDLVVQDAVVVDEALRPLSSGADSFFALRGVGPGFWRNVARNGFMGCAMSMRRRVFEWAAPFPEGGFLHDQWLGLVATLRGKVCFLAAPGLKYRRHGGNVTAMRRSSLARVTALRLRLLWALLRLRLSGRK